MDEQVYKLQSKIPDVELFESSLIWQDILALIQGRMYDITEKLLDPVRTKDIDVLRLLQGAREELSKMRDLPAMLKEELEIQNEKEDEDGRSSQ